MLLWRPVGPVELELIAQSGFRAFPPRLPEQPIFYPVLTLEYAQQIARDWNAAREPFAGFVIQFSVEDKFVKRYDPHTVGSRTHRELWVPAEELADFNQHIEGQLKVVTAYYGDGYQGKRPKYETAPLE